MVGGKKDLKPLSARHAVICAAVSGWHTDSPCSWLSPTSAQTVVEWAHSYPTDASTAVLAEAFVNLARDGLFYRVLYPVFREPQYICSYEGSFLNELPADIGDYISDASPGSMRSLWEDVREEHNASHGIAWHWWGLCAAQGSQGPSGSPIGPCLGPSCCWFQDGSSGCNWQIEFADVPRDGWPDMSFLSCGTGRRARGPDSYVTQIIAARKALELRAPDLPWPLDDEHK